jgi:hypothetical protein
MMSKYDTQFFCISRPSTPVTQATLSRIRCLTKNITATTRDARTMRLLLHKGVRRQFYMFFPCNIVPYLLLHIFVILFLIAFVHVFAPISEVPYISADVLWTNFNVFNIPSMLYALLMLSNF